MTTPDGSLADRDDPAMLEVLGDLAERAARLGGATLLQWRSKFEAREKGPADLVTDADLASQEAVQSLLLGERPHDLFVGEEDGSIESDRPSDKICWVVDPLDGTANYVHGFPFFATSVAAVRGSELLAGAIYDPLRDELYRAEQGRGARLNGKPLSVSETESLDQSLVAVSLPPRVEPDSPDLMHFIKAIQKCQAVRRSGSAALNLAYVASGRLDAHWAHAIYPWDVAAGVLMVAEAGGVVSSCSGGEFDLWRADYLVAATEPLHTETVRVLHDPR